jgi:putative transcriptional regulator
LTGEFVKALRIKLEMTQETFCDCYHIPLATLRNWEQNRRTPDITSQAFLHVIDAMPLKVAKVLSRLPPT